MEEAKEMPTKPSLSKLMDLVTSYLGWKDGLHGDLLGGTCWDGIRDYERQCTLQNILLPLTDGSMLGTKEHLKQKKEIDIKSKDSRYKVLVNLEV